MYDVCIIGAGIAGCMCARELAAYDLSVLVLEAGPDVCSGTSRANSGIVHAGHDPLSGSKKAIYNVRGAKLYPRLAAELGFEYIQCGAMVVAFANDDMQKLHELLERGIANGVSGLRIMKDPELHEREPNLSPSAKAALWVPTSAIVDPYGATLASAQNAAENGVEFKLTSYVEKVERISASDACSLGADHVSPGDDDSPFAWRVSFYSTKAADCNSAREPAQIDDDSQAAERIMQSPPRAMRCESADARFVINACGLESGRINNQVSANKIELTPRAGEYVLLDRAWGGAFGSTIFQVPGKEGKGVLITPTVEGNLLIGPNASAHAGAFDTSTSNEGLSYVLGRASRTWERIPTRDAITNFAGLRASCLDNPDFILGEPSDAPGFFNIAGFDSPGLSSAPAVAIEFAQEIAQRLYAKPRANYNPRREAPARFSKLDDEQRAKLIAQDPAWGRIVCRCEMVTEAEVVSALAGPLPATTTDAVKWRTRAGMGRCQAGFCLPTVAQIMARELEIDATSVCKGWPGSRLALGRRGCLDALPGVAGVAGSGTGRPADSGERSGARGPAGPASDGDARDSRREARP